jgi:hypothetical protein
MHAKYARLFADASGVSRFADIDVELHPGFAVPPATPLSVADFVLTERCSWVGGTRDWQGDVMHPVPRRMLFVVIRGEFEITAGDGEARRRYSPGSVILAEDTTGTGHATRIVSSDGVVLVFSLVDARRRTVRGAMNQELKGR